MKKRNSITAVAALALMTVFIPRAVAQAPEMEKMIKKLMASNTTTMVLNYKGKNRTKPFSTEKITFSEKALQDDFLKVFEASKSSADVVHTNRKGGGEVNSIIFNVDGISHLYSYFKEDNSSTAFVIHSRYHDAESAKKGSENLSATEIIPELKGLERWHELKANAEIETIHESESHYIAGQFAGSRLSQSLNTRMGNHFFAFEHPSVRNAFYLAIPHRIDIKGKCVITDGVNILTAEGIGFGEKGGSETRTDSSSGIVIVLDKNSEISVDYEKCTIDEARAKGLNIVVF